MALLTLVTAGCGASEDHVLGAPVQGPTTRPAAAERVTAARPDLTGRKVSADNYAMGVCVGLDQFGLDYAAARAHRAAALSGSPTTVRTALLGYYDSLDQAFDRMSVAVRAAGIPQLEHGEAMATGVVATIGEARRAGDRHRPEVQALPTADRTKFRPAAGRLVRDSDRDVESAMHRLGRFDVDPKFRGAFDRAQACPHR
jgi:hypothetical protein